METVVMKFGGAAVATPAQFGTIAEIVLRRQKTCRVVVVVSAMGDMTDELLALARQVHPDPPLREQDMLISVGERISVALLAMALSLQGGEAMSFTGSQSGIITSKEHSQAKILDVRPFRLEKSLQGGNVVIVAGFQGVSREGEITTLGRGGSDTTAIALGIALQASRVEFYKDVPAIYSEDPKKNPNAIPFTHLSYEEALAIMERGGQVLHSRCLQLAAKNGVPIHVRSFFDPDLQKGVGTYIGDVREGEGHNYSLTFEKATD